MHIRYLVRWLLMAAPLGVPVALFAQGGTCGFPLVVTRFNASSRATEIVKDLSADDLQVTVTAKKVVIANLALDSTPKRVALILDASTAIPDEEWKLQTEMAGSLVSHGRPEDRFTLLVIGREDAPGSFLTASEAREQLLELRTERPGLGNSREPIYDALLASARKLSPPRFGDVLFLFGHDEDSGSTAAVSQVRDLVLKNRIRLYAMSFTNPLLGKLPPHFDLNKHLPPSFRPSPLDGVAHETGWFVSYHAVDAVAFPGQSELLKGFLAELYDGIAEPYRIDIGAGSVQKESKLEITVSNENVRPRDVHYARALFACVP